MKKDLFLKNNENKQAFIKMLGKKLQSSGFPVFHADDDDADVLIVKKAIEVSQTANTAVIGDNTDLLVLLLYHARNIKSFDIFFHPGSKQFARKKPITVNIHSAVRKLGTKLCENIIFLLTGLRIYTGEYKAQGPTLCPTEGRALRGPRALYSPV